MALLLAFANVGLGLERWRLLDAAATDRRRPRPRIVLAGRADPLKLPNDYGLVTRLVPPSEVLGAAEDLASRLASGPTTAHAAIKNAIGFSASHTLEESLENEATQQAVAGATRDHRTTVAAFAYKARPTSIGG